MPYGSPLGITLPANGDAWPLWNSKLLAALTTLISTLESKVTPSGMDWSTGSVDGEDQPLIDLAYLGLHEQSVPGAVPGTVVNVGGDLYWVNDSGVAVQLTIGSNPVTSTLTRNVLVPLWSPFLTAATQAPGTNNIITVNAGGSAVVPVHGLVEQDQLNSVSFRLNWTAGTITCNIYRHSLEGVRSTVGTGTVTAGGVQTKVISVGSPSPLNAGESHTIEVTSTNAGQLWRSAWGAATR